MQSKEVMRTREIHFAQAKACKVRQAKRQGWPDGGMEVRLPDSTPRLGEPITRGSGQQEMNCSWET
ncbi:hypothetical protein CR161_10295 [Prosthecochloris sp. ZM]|nr:hypothetical protein CR161_10295 [Prosthecochloris sp. ZM]